MVFGPHWLFRRGWSESLTNGDPKPLPIYLDGSDTNTASQLEGSIRQNLGDFQMKERDIIDRHAA